MANTEREIRIAVVMYGGTSLAIYMNGISQEFLQLVRATSPAVKPEALGGTARVYRKLAHVLSGTAIDQITDDVLATPPRVRFVIDILSGTSAGGINSVMLAKALARNSDLEPLKRLWLDEGAIGSLINDRQSATPRYPYREPVRSLFNSDRMFVELLNAIERLNRPADSPAEPLVHNLALTVTGTDLTGDPIDIRLADGIAQEYNHKQTFEFRLDWPKTDEFQAAWDPLLAFVARTTSSLPAVFEPSTVAVARELSGKDRAERAPWSQLFRSLRDAEGEDHDRHAFADGGYLDNKPFGHAIDHLAQAPTGVHVTRKLYFLEPQPQRIEPDTPLGGTPSALANTLKVVTLARYETIRSDIERLTERNRLLQRVRTLGLGVLEDLSQAPRPVLDMSGDLSVQTAALGPTYGGYHRLRVGTLTDTLAETVAGFARVDPESDLRRAIRLVVQAWRNAHFARDASGSLEAESMFLKRFDVPFHRRRAVFLLNKINQLFHFDDAVARELDHVTGDRDPENRFGAITALLADFRGGPDARAGAVERWSGLDELLRQAKTLAQRSVVALDAEHPLPAGTMDLTRTIEAQGAHALDGLRVALRRILGEAPGVAAEQAARDFLNDHDELVEGLAARLEEHQGARMGAALAEMADLEGLPVPEGLATQVRALLVMYWERFLYFDMVQFPLVEATGVGDELSPIEIHRMSPADCRHYATFDGDKLMGTRFATFGAFLDRRWRESDIRWGRLDGAERLITTLLGRENEGAREQLVVEAHLAILREEFPADRATIEALVASRDAGPGAALDVSSTKHKTEEFLQERKAPADLEPQQSATTLSRLLRTSNKLVDTLTTDSSVPLLLRNAIGLTSLAGSELFQAAIPKSFKHLLVTYWANLLLLFGGLLLALALLLPGGSPFRAGVGLGVLLVAVALLGLFLQSLLWRLLVPPAEVRAEPAFVPSMQLGKAALLLGVVVIAANVILEWPGAWSQQSDRFGYRTSALAIQTVGTSGELACVLGASVVANGCVAPTGTPAGAAVERARALVFVDFGFIVLYVSLLGLVGLAAVRASGLKLGLLGVGLAVAAGTLDAWENVRILETLATDYGQMADAWLVDTARVARAKFVAGFAAVAVLLPTLRLHATTSLLNVRMVTWGFTIVGAAGVGLGAFGLVLDYPVPLGYGLLVLVVLMLGLAVLFLAGHLLVPVRAPVEEGGEAVRA